METIKNIYKIGNGPSSSHTIGPRKAALQFKSHNSNAAAYSVTLYGSLAATGAGHMTDVVIKDVFKDTLKEFIWKPEIFLPFHPNGMKFEAFDSQNNLMKEWVTYSIGGGFIADENTDMSPDIIYDFTTMKDILVWCESNGKTLWEYVESREDNNLWEYLAEVWDVMKKAIKRGIEEEGTLPGPIKLPRKAASYFIKAQSHKGSLKRRSLLFSYALAVAEENAAGNVIVTAPTCGSSGVLPAALYLLETSYKFPDKKIYRALATAGLIGNLVKKNASISGAEVGCQGEIGTACAMAAAATQQLFGGTPPQIEYSAEMGLEHHLGLTCDPVAGLVQVPCIERNAFAASRALDANTYSMLSDGRHHISFDKVVKTMKHTGHDLPSLYKETSAGGLAKDYD